MRIRNENPNDHIELLKSHMANGTLIRGAWTGKDAQGRQTACLLAAMVPQCGQERSSIPCPATVMPRWLAYLTPNLDDRGSIEAWPAMVERFASLAARWHSLDEAAWRRVQFGWLAAVVREAAAVVREAAITAVCERVAALCDGVVTTGVIDAASFQKAQTAAEEAAASWAEEAAASWTARAAAAAAWTAAVRAARAAAAAAWTARA